MLLKLRTLPAFLCLVFLLAFGSLAAAQDTESFLEGQREMLSGIENSVAGLETEIGHQSTDDAELVDIRVELERLGREVFDASLAFRPRLSEINTRLEQLGEPRKEGEPS